MYCLAPSTLLHGHFMKKCCLLLFSISVAIGQFSSKWPGSSSCTVKIVNFYFMNLFSCFLMLFVCLFSFIFDHQLASKKKYLYMSTNVSIVLLPVSTSSFSSPSHSCLNKLAPVKLPSPPITTYNRKN